MSGNVWMFSDEIDDEDLEFMSQRPYPIYVRRQPVKETRYPGIVKKMAW